MVRSPEISVRALKEMLASFLLLMKVSDSPILVRLSAMNEVSWGFVSNLSDCSTELRAGALKLLTLEIWSSAADSRWVMLMTMLLPLLPPLLLMIRVPVMLTMSELKVFSL